MAISIAVISSRGRRKCLSCDGAILKGEKFLHIHSGSAEWRDAVGVNICMKCIRMYAIRHLEDSLKVKHRVMEWDRAEGVEGFNADGTELLPSRLREGNNNQ